MKKIALTAATLFAIALHGRAQTVFPIYDASDNDIETFYFAQYDATVELDTLRTTSQETPYLHIQADTKSWGGMVTIGTVGTSSYTTLNYPGKVETTTFRIRFNTAGTVPVLKLQFNVDPGMSFAYIKTFPIVQDTGFSTFEIPLSEFKEVVNNNPTGLAFSNEMLEAANTQFNFVFNDNWNTILNVAEVALVNNDIATGLETAVATVATNAYPNPNSGSILYLGNQEKAFTLLNTRGTVVKAGNDTRILLNDLEKGVYFLQTTGKTEKIILH